jgi:hypothetical protein
VAGCGIIAEICDDELLVIPVDVAPQEEVYG